MSMSAIKTALDNAGAGTSEARIDFRYIKRGSLQLPGVASDQDYRANYLIYSNDNIHYFGAWIDSIDWSSAGSFTVTFTDDNFTTFAAGATVNGYRTRCNKFSGTPLPWHEMPGDFAVNETEIVDVWGLRLNPSGENPIIVYVNAEATPAQMYNPNGVMYTPFIPVVLKTSAARDLFRDMLNSTWWSSNMVIAAYVIPEEFLSNVQQYGTVHFGTGTGWDFPAIPTGYGLNTTSVNIFNSVTGDKRFLLNSHDSKLQIRLGKTAVTVPFETIKSGSIKIEMGLSPSPVIAFTPDWHTSDRDKSPKYAFTDFSQFAFSESTFNEWLLKNALPAIGSGTYAGFAGGGSAGAGAIGAVAGGLASTVGTFTNYMLSHPTPETTTGSTSSIDAVAGASAAIQLVMPKDSDRALNFYKRFGYPCAHAETINFSNWSPDIGNYSFIQSTDNAISGTMPAAAKDEIDAMLKAGVRCWNTIDIGDYS